MLDERPDADDLVMGDLLGKGEGVIGKALWTSNS